MFFGGRSFHSSLPSWFSVDCCTVSHLEPLVSSFVFLFLAFVALFSRTAKIGYIGSHFSCLKGSLLVMYLTDSLGVEFKVKKHFSPQNFEGSALRIPASSIVAKKFLSFWSHLCMLPVCFFSSFWIFFLSMKFWNFIIMYFAVSPFSFILLAIRRIFYQYAHALQLWDLFFIWFSTSVVSLPSETP